MDARTISPAWLLISDVVGCPEWKVEETRGIEDGEERIEASLGTVAHDVADEIDNEGEAGPWQVCWLQSKYWFRYGCSDAPRIDCWPVMPGTCCPPKFASLPKDVLFPLYGRLGRHWLFVPLMELRTGPLTVLYSWHGIYKGKFSRDPPVWKRGIWTFLIKTYIYISNYLSFRWYVVLRRI